MSSILFKNIKQLVGTANPQQVLRGDALADLPVLPMAYLIVEDGHIADFGSMDFLPGLKRQPQVQVDLSGRLVLPCWCDSHTHLVFPGSREGEFVDRIKGMSYAEIAAKGGGILHSAQKLHAMTEDQLFRDAWKRLEEISRLGTGAVEIKSGYGLTVEDELKMLRVIRKLRERSPLQVKSTFLGAHAYPLEYRDDHPGYIKLIVEEMLPAIAAEQLADYVDVFCEQGFFSLEETEIICREAHKYGLRPRLHAHQLSISGGVETGIRMGALSVDHLEMMDAHSIQMLAQSDTIGTLLPAAAFFLHMPFQPARQLIDAGCAIALASDYNPGSSPSGNMNLVVSMGCISMAMWPAEAINAATINGAFAMELNHNTGSITPGKRADLIVTQPVPSLEYLPYAFGSNLVERVMIAGEWIS